MNVLIKGMEKPEHCGYCRFRYDGICHALQKTQYSMDECPLVGIDDAGLNDDLISRQAAIAYAISGLTREIDGENWIRVSEVRESIKAISSPQPEIIRCKDCKHWTTMVERPKHGMCDQWCTLNVTRRDEYCSKAERKES